VFGRVEIDCFILAAVDFEVGLLVAGEIEAAECDASFDRRFPDGCEDWSSRSVNLSRPSDVEREKMHVEILLG
jgi:hypothetical protein